MLVCNVNTEIEDSQAATTTYPDHIVNGDFQYWEGLPDTNTWLYIGIDHGTYLDARDYVQTKKRYPLPASFDKSKFAWRNTQDLTSPSYLVPGEVQIDNSHKFADGSMNRTVDLVTTQVGRCIYQDISTTPGSVYKWSLKHAATQVNSTDKMSVMIGTPSNQTAQDAYRTASPAGNDTLGYVGKTIQTKFKDDYTTTDKWDVYEGVYLVPQGQTITRFTFQDLNGTTSTNNHLDDIFFAIADPLYYDLNGGIGDVPIPTPSGSYPGYHQRYSTVDLSEVTPTRTGYTLLGWSEEKLPDISSESQYRKLMPQISNEHTMSAGSNTVYAVWGKNPVVSFVDGVTGDVIQTISIPFNTSVPGNLYPTPATHDWHDFAGFSETPGAICEDVVITAEYKRNDLIGVPVEIEWHDNNDYAGLRPKAVTLSLYADGVKVDSKTVSEDDNWRCIFDELPAHADDGHLIAYRIVRESESGMPSDYDVVDIEQNYDNVPGLLMNATYVATVSVPVIKIWDDMNNVYNERPDSIEIILNKNGEEYDRLNLTSPEEGSTSSDENGSVESMDEWTGHFSSIPLWDENEAMITWSIDEAPVYGYNLLPVEPNGENINNGFTVTNRIWKHIDMPETGNNKMLWIWVAAGTLILLGIVGITRFRFRETIRR